MWRRLKRLSSMLIVVGVVAGATLVAAAPAHASCPSGVTPFQLDGGPSISCSGSYTQYSGLQVRGYSTGGWTGYITLTCQGGSPGCQDGLVRTEFFCSGRSVGFGTWQDPGAMFGIPGAPVGPVPVTLRVLELVMLETTRPGCPAPPEVVTGVFGGAPEQVTQVFGTAPPGGSPPSTWPAATPYGIGVKRDDYNRDGVSDIVAVKDDMLHRWWGDGGGGFTYAGTYGPGWSPYASTLTAPGDINGDGVGDLVAVKDDLIHRWFGNGSGGFTYAGTYGPGWTPYASSLTGVGDLNRDGYGDIVAVLNDYLYRWYGGPGGSLTFGGTNGPGWGIYAQSLAGPGDINGDGIADIVAVDEEGVLQRWFGDGTGNVYWAGSYGPGWLPYERTLMGAGDINRDGRGDLLAVSDDLLHRWRGIGGGGFVYAGTYGPGWLPYFPASAMLPRWKLTFIKTANTGGTVEVHQDPAPFNAYVSSTSGFNPADRTNGTWSMVGDRLVFIKTRNTSGTVELHWRTAATDFREGLSVPTWFSPADGDNGVFSLVGDDLVFIKTRNTGGSIEVHKVGAFDAMTPTLHSASVISAAEAGNGVFQMFGNDLVFIKTRNTGSGKIEVHIADGDCNFCQWKLHAATTFSTAEAANGEFFLRDVIGADGIGDLVFLKTRNTGTGTIELFEESGATGFTHVDLATATAFNPADAANGTFVMNF